MNRKMFCFIVVCIEICFTYIANVTFFSLNLNYVCNVEISDRNFDIINRDDEIRFFDNNHDNLNKLNVKKMNSLKR